MHILTELATITGALCLTQRKLRKILCISKLFSWVQYFHQGLLHSLSSYWSRVITHMFNCRLPSLGHARTPAEGSHSSFRVAQEVGGTEYRTQESQSQVSTACRWSKPAGKVVRADVKRHPILTHIKSNFKSLQFLKK